MYSATPNTPRGPSHVVEPAQAAGIAQEGLTEALSQAPVLSRMETFTTNCAKRANVWVGVAIADAGDPSPNVQLYV